MDLFLIFMEIKNKILFNSRDWVTVASANLTMYAYTIVE